MEKEIRSLLLVIAILLAAIFFTINHNAATAAHDFLHSPLLWLLLGVTLIILVLVWLYILFETFADWLQDWWDNLPFWPKLKTWFASWFAWWPKGDTWFGWALANVLSILAPAAVVVALTSLPLWWPF